MKLLLAPHNDDECLWAAFTILREMPLVVIVTDSFKQQNNHLPITALQRRQETLAAMAILGAECEFLGYRDDERFSGLEKRLREYGEPEMVYAPAPEVGGHPHHNMIGALACQVFENVTFYMTYTKAGKSTATPVPFEREWPLLKLRALACYESQILEPSTRDHFLREQYEYTHP